VDDIEKLMLQWDSWREYIASGGGGSWPRDAFESVLDMFDGRIKELEAALKKYGVHICENKLNCCPLAWRACRCDSCIERRKEKGIHNKCTCGLEEVING